ncbi:unnamed protein product [Meloidogyne enterolobii]|uniref:Uncharacterized protein n=1 Tax=Meloidogyne enterolobii TaxID=390850 RepID=A0ACB0XSV8_MELEN
MSTGINIYIILFSTLLLFQLINANQQECVGEGGNCQYDTDCCVDKNITCVGSSKTRKKKGTCQKVCDLDGAICEPTPESERDNCCNCCDNITKKCYSKNITD